MLKNLFKQCILIFLNFQLSNLISYFLHGVANLATGLPSLALDVVVAKSTRQVVGKYAAVIFFFSCIHFGLNSSE
jgi:hypothetical protein